MASVHRKKGTRYFTGAFTGPNGKQYQRSTRSTKKAEALQIALKWEELARSEATANQAQRVLADIVKMVSGELFAPQDAREFFKRWIDRQELAPRSRERYQAAIADFIGRLPTGIKLSGITSSDVVAFRDAEAARVSAVSANMALTVVKAALSAAKADHHIAEDPAASVKRLKRPKVAKSENGANTIKRRPFTREEVERMLANLNPSDEWYGMILVGVYTGQRLGDATRMRRSAIKNGIWEFTSGKTKREMHIPLAKPLLAWIEKHAKGDLVFPTLAAIPRSGTLSGGFRRVMAAVGVSKPKEWRNRGIGRKSKRAASEVGYHSFRHTLTSWLKEAGVAQAVVMEFVGHESKSVNQGYTHMPMSALQDAAKLLPDVTAGLRNNSGEK